MSSTKAIIGIIVVVILIWLGFTLLDSAQPVDGEPLKIGVATILSGDFAAAGENMVNAVQMAVDEVNQNGGVDGRPLEIVVEDSMCDSKGGLNASQKLINVDDVKYIVGGMCSNGTLAAAPLANESKVIIMTPVTGGKNVDEAGEYIFRNANSDILAGRDIAEAMLKLGYSDVGVVSAITEYTLDIKNTFEKTIKDNGGTIVVSEEFLHETSDYRTLISKIQDADPQALLILSQLGTDAGTFIKQSNELGYNPPLFTDFTFATNENAKSIAGSFEGIYFADPAYDEDNRDTKKFFEEYEKRFKIPSLIPFHAAASYDVVMMYVEAIKEVGDDSEKVKDWLLENVQERQGLMGEFSFDENGNSNLGFTVKQIIDGSPEVVELQ